MTRRVLSWIGVLLYGGAAGWLLPFPLALLAIVLPFAAGHLYRHYLWPRRTRRMLQRVLDPSAGPPPGAEPVVSEWPRRLDDLARARRWDELDSLLAEDFSRVYLTGARYDRARYLASLRLKTDDFHEREQTMLALPAEPEVLWVRSSLLVTPRYGRDYDFTQWTRYTFAPGSGRLRELANVAVVEVS
jgi:hypothetical protein